MSCDVINAILRFGEYVCGVWSWRWRRGVLRLCLVSVGGAVAGGGGGGGGRDRVGELAGSWAKRRGDFTQVGMLGSRSWRAGEASADQAYEEPRGTAVVDGLGRCMVPWVRWVKLGWGRVRWVSAG